MRAVISAIACGVFAVGCGDVSEPVVIIDGFQHGAEELLKYEGQPLHFYVDADAQREGVTYVFTTEDGRWQHQQSRMGVRAQHTDMADCRTFFYEDVNYSNSKLPLPMGSEIGDLRDYREDWNDSWNDQFSSLRANPCGVYGTCIYSDLSFRGSSFCVAPGVDVPDLRNHGWNDRATSAKVFY